MGIWRELPKDTLKQCPHAFYRHKDGRVVRLPADAYSLNHYLQKGLVIVEEEVVSIKRKPRKARRKTKKGGKP